MKGAARPRYSQVVHRTADGFVGPRPLSRPMATLFVVLGWICIGLAVLGAMLPVLPTTPWVLLAGYLFARSSPRFHVWITRHRFFGPMLRDWRSGLGVTVRTKVIAIGTLLLSMTLSAFLVRIWWVWLILAVIAIGVSTYLLRLPTRPTERRQAIGTD